MHEKFQPVELTSKPSEESLKSRLKPDPRLPADAVVLGIDRREKPGAVPLDLLEKQGKFAVEPETFEFDTPIVVFWQASTRTAAAYFPTAEKHKPSTRLGVVGEVEAIKSGLEITADGKSDDAPFVDQKTGSRFDIAGRCVAGELKGWALLAVPAVQCKWFAWAAEYPSTVIKRK
jgi:hypothetical protein